MSISVASGDITFTTSAASRAIARSEVTTTDGDAEVSFSFSITRNALTLRVGTTSGGQEVIPDMLFEPGTHTITFTPGAATYYIEWSLHRIGKAVLNDFARVAAGTLNLDAPWTVVDFASLRLQQSLNVSWLTSGSYQTRVIERRGPKSWGIRLFQPEDGPFNTLNATDISITPSAQTGEITLTSSAPLFKTLDVGHLLKVTHAGQYETATFDAVDEVTEAIRVSGIEQSRVFRYAVDFSTGSFVGTVVLERSIGNEVNWETVQTHSAHLAETSYDDGLDNQIAFYRLRCSARSSGTAAPSLTHAQGVTDGIARIVTVNADNEVTADVLEPFSAVTASTVWYWGAWGLRFGWPQAVGMYDGRLFFARGGAYWGSASDAFETFKVGAEDADAVARTFTGRIASARWLKGVMKMLGGTSGSEHTISSGELSEVITPANVMSRAMHSRGSADADAVVIDNSVAFISKNKKRIYLLTGTGGGDQYQLVDLTELHEDIGGTLGFKELAFQREPWPRLWALREDGVAAVLLLNESQQVAAWARYTVTAGTIKSICVITSDTEDEVYFAVQRTIGAQTVYYTEKLVSEAFGTVSEAWRLQSGELYSGAATTTLTMMDHLNGENAYVWANGRQSGPHLVTNGVIELDFETTYAIAGLLYTGKYKGGRLDFGAQIGSALTKEKQVKHLGLMLYRTAGGAVQWGPNYTDLDTLRDKQESGEAYDSPLQLWTQDISAPFESDTEHDQRLHIVMPSAGPATVLGLVPDIQTNEG